MYAVHIPALLFAVLLQESSRASSLLLFFTREPLNHFSYSLLVFFSSVCLAFSCLKGHRQLPGFVDTAQHASRRPATNFDQQGAPQTTMAGVCLLELGKNCQISGILSMPHYFSERQREHRAHNEACQSSLQAEKPGRSWSRRGTMRTMQHGRGSEQMLTTIV